MTNRYIFFFLESADIHFPYRKIRKAGKNFADISVF